jgi:16S rRNA (adenine1518-N6/adenine1519-N6)-dimethyltransferase
MSTGSSRNQTLSFLLRRFREAGIRPQNRLGQNFLIDMNLQRLLLDTAALGPDDVVLEIGSGSGGLTHLMAEQAVAVVTVEVDKYLFNLASEDLFGLDNVTMLQADALKNKNRLDPQMLEAVAVQLNAAPGRRFKLVANLPYNVATPILSNLLALDRPPETMTFTIQKEVADRIVAQPGTKAYGALAIWIQCQCRSEVIRILPPSVFWPRPKVSSAFVQIAIDPQRRGRIPDRAFFHDFVRSMFFHRRKFLRSQLLSACKDHLDKAEVDVVLAERGLDGSMRAEVLSPDDMLALCEAVRSRWGTFDATAGAG